MLHRRTAETEPSAPPGPENHLRVEGISKRFGHFKALDDVSFTLGRGELLCILGPSGCGKTTLLRAVAGLDRQDAGSVLLDGRDVSLLPVSRRHVGIVFQSYALFPNLTAAQNIAYGLQTRGMPRSRVKDRVEELLALVGLQGQDRKFPSQLSGGQQQRVALARAIAPSPSLLLLDEPLSALDAQVRSRLRMEIRSLQQRLGVTTLMVTHDQEEALAMADRILVMDRGRALQAGTPDEIYNSPGCPFVASFIGSMNFIRDTVKESPRTFRKGSLRLLVEDSGPMPDGAAAILAIRPEDIEIRQNGEPSRNLLKAEVQRLEYRGSNFRVAMSLLIEDSEASLIEADVTAEKVRKLRICEKTRIHVDLPTHRLLVYAA
ncbi:MAG: putative 2-aminoethylphosphonate ABC transporter ATP-binding protein [Syntrophobacteraceae bacterium]|nr:putative 2-aminoethylphosphonate ABC transporter ATP-binding protein [Syntrophobacteraceae bacterium]